MTKPLYLTKAQRLALVAAAERAIQYVYIDVAFHPALQIAIKKLKEVPSK